MALKRIEGKEMSFVTNEHFEKLGVSRQVVEHQRVLGKIHPFAMVKGMNLYYKLDADILILRYWMGSFRRFITEWEESKKIRRAASKRSPEVKARFDKGGDENADRAWLADEHDELQSVAVEGASSLEFYKLSELMHQYRLTKNRIKLERIGELDPRRYISDEIDDFLYRVCAYVESGLSLNEYLRREKTISTRSPDYLDVLVRFFKRAGRSINTKEAFDLRDRIFARIHRQPACDK